MQLLHHTVAVHLSLRSLKLLYGWLIPRLPLISAASFWAAVRRWGGLGLLVIGVVDSSFIPTFGSLDIFNAVLAARHPDLWWYYALTSTAGSLAGAYLMYRVASKAGTHWLEKHLGEGRVRRVRCLLERWGTSAVVISVIAPPPFPTSAVFAAAGALNFPVRKYLLATLGGRIFRYALVAWIASHYSRHIIRVFRHPSQYLPITLGVTGALILLAIIAGIIWHYTSRELERAEREIHDGQHAPIR